MSFASLGLADELLRAVSEQGYQTPTPIQQQGIPAVLSGRDVMAAAQTGTGKTASFVLPMVQRLAAGARPKANQARALVLTPTRELAAQVGESVRNYSRHLKIRSTVVFGGVKINPQMMALRGGVDVLVATPGRLLDLCNQNAVRFDQLEVLVLDEADRMLDMGFIHDIRRIQKLLPTQRQTLMFSATFSEEIRQLAKGMINNPLRIEVSPANTTATTVQQVVHPVDKARKKEALRQLIEDHDWQQVLVFARTKSGANRLAHYLSDQGLLATAIHGDKTQGARTRALANFKKGNVRVLVATDIAARGLDIDQLPHVVNFDLPHVPEDYVHRIGRTGRAGAQGWAVSLVSADEAQQLAAIEKLIGRKLQRKFVAGFEPNHNVPESQVAKRAPTPTHKPQSSGKRPPATKAGKTPAKGARQSPGPARAKPNLTRKPRRRQG